MFPYAKCARLNFIAFILAIERNVRNANLLTNNERKKITRYFLKRSDAVNRNSLETCWYADLLKKKRKTENN